MTEGTKSGGYFELERQFVFYASYHNNPVNVAIHLVCIWNLLWSILYLLHLVSLPPALELAPLSLLGQQLPLDLSAIFAVIWMVAFILMEPLVGSVGAGMVLALHSLTFKLSQEVEVDPLSGLQLWKIVLALHIFLWVLQFIGHGVFEKRAPALLDSLDQALITAPLFVLLEVFCFCGYRPQFYKKCMKQVEENIGKFKSQKIN